MNGEKTINRIKTLTEMLVEEYENFNLTGQVKHRGSVNNLSREISKLFVQLRIDLALPVDKETEE